MIKNFKTWNNIVINNFKIPIALLQDKTSLRSQLLGFLGLMLTFSLLSSCMCETPTNPTTTTMPSATITNHTFSVNENALSNSFVGAVNASDNSNVSSFSITDGNVSNAFSISTTNGILTTASDIDYGTTSNYSLIVQAVDAANNTISAMITVNVNDLLDEWTTRYYTNGITNDQTTEATNLSSTPISALSNKMFIWLDASVFSLLNLNANEKLTNWIDRNSYAITGTNTNFFSTVMINTSAEMRDGELVGFTNISNNSITVIALSLASAISATPKSDLANNDSLSVYAPAGESEYVTVDYQGNDRVGFKIDTTSMGASDSIKAFYLVTSLAMGNNKAHVPLGYSNLNQRNRMISKSNDSRFYVPDGGGLYGKGNIALGDSTFKRNRDFPVPSVTHLLSRRGLSISKSQLNGILGTFPISGNEGGEQRIRELIIFTNTVSDLDHSNVVKYLLEKWNIPREPVTNLYSYYSHFGNHVIENVLDDDLGSFFYADNSSIFYSESNRILLEVTYYPGVLNPLPLSFFVNGVSKGKHSIFFRSGHNRNEDPIKVAFRLEILDTNGNDWRTLTNVRLNLASGERQFYFFLDDSSNDFLGYRLVSESPPGSVLTKPNSLTIDHFFPSAVSLTSPFIKSFTNTAEHNTQYPTNEILYPNGFTNYIHFTENVYELEPNDFTVVNGTVTSITAISDNSSYAVVVRPHGFYGSGPLIQSTILTLDIPEGVVTNRFGKVNNHAHLYLDLVSNFLATPSQLVSAKPAFGDVDADGDMDMLVGVADGFFRFYRNDGNGTYSEQSGTNDPFLGLTVEGDAHPVLGDLDKDGDLDMLSTSYRNQFEANIGRFKYFRNDGDATNASFSEQTGTNNPFVQFLEWAWPSTTLVDFDGDGDLDMVSGSLSGKFNFYRNNGNASFSKQTGTSNPLNGFDVGEYSDPTFVDIDGDGDLDMVSGDQNGNFHFYHNQKGFYIWQGGINNPLTGLNSGRFSSPVFADVDGDGDLDLVNSGGSFEGIQCFLKVGENYIKLP